jgi:hypothetical protein
MPDRNISTEGRLRAGYTALFVLVLAAAPVSAREVVDIGAARRVLAGSAAVEGVAQLAALARTGAVDELGAQLERVVADARLNSIEREWLLDRGLHDLARLTPSPAARAIVEGIARREPEVFVRVDPDHGRHAVPLYDPPATARFVLRTWMRAAARDQALAGLQANLSWPLERFAQTAAAAELDPAQAGIADAFDRAAPAVLLRYRGAVIGAIERGERVDELALRMAVRLRDRELHALVIDHADADIALAAVRLTGELFDASPAFESLVQASRRSEIASAATLEIGRVAREDVRARTHLFDVLHDAALAASAAAALAALHDPAVAVELGRRLQGSTQEAARRQLVLALKLDGSPEARDVLQRFAKASAGSPELQKEVRAWLAH